jgi:hypothetical protein
MRHSHYFSLFRLDSPLLICQLDHLYVLAESNSLFFHDFLVELLPDPAILSSGALAVWTCQLCAAQTAAPPSDIRT